MIRIGEHLESGDAIIIVDVQIDFCPGGALPVEEGDRVVPVLNRCIDAAVPRNIPVIASRDWHPLGHVSFREAGGPWPEHCLQDSEGARFHPDLKLPQSVIKVTKGTRFDHDQYSAFDETGLDVALRRMGILRLWVGGLAEDVCVCATVLDGVKNGFEVVLIENGVRPITPEGGEKARRRMRAAGVRFEMVE